MSTRRKQYNDEIWQKTQLRKKSNLPKHVAIIMDGNGRWATRRKLPRILGHREGGKVVEEITKICIQKGIPVLTLFAFSTENWHRPQEEIDYLMNLFLNVLDNDVEQLHENHVKLQIIGDVTLLNEQLQVKILAAERLTFNNTGLKLNLAINYSGRWDIFQAVKAISKAVETGLLQTQNLTQELFQSKLSLAGLPEPDLFIRTSGELRISNFLLWQLAYTELYFTDVLWPDFNQHIFDEALNVYAKRNRRFGEIKKEESVYEQKNYGK